MQNRKENAITEILKQLAAAKNYSEINAAVCEKFQVSSRTFDNYWKEAKEQHKEKHEAVRMMLADKTVRADEEAAKKGVIERIERLTILTSISRGEAQKRVMPNEGGNPVISYVFPTVTEQNKSLDMLTRMGEGYSPVKKDFQVDSTRDFVINIE